MSIVVLLLSVIVEPFTATPLIADIRTALPSKSLIDIMLNNSTVLVVEAVIKISASLINGATFVFLIFMVAVLKSLSAPCESFTL